MADQMQRSACMLVMEYVPGTALFTVNKPFQEEKLEQTAADLGRWASCAGHSYVRACMPSTADVGTCSTAQSTLFPICCSSRQPQNIPTPTLALALTAT